MNIAQNSSEDSLFPWIRYWTPRGKAPKLDSFGFLREGADDAVADGLWSIDDISALPCLVLLGEPGIGKTVTLRQLDEHESTLNSMSSVFISLASITSARALSDAIFAKDTISQWVTGSDVLRLYLDGIDESLLRPEDIAELIAREFSLYPLERLRLRITCRSGAWPAVIEESIRSVWPAEKIGFFELVPLRRSDLDVAAIRNRFMGTDFFTNLIAHDLAHLAPKPLTLRLLLDALPAKVDVRSRVSLFIKACQQLLSKPRADALDSKATEAGNLLAVSARIAAVLTFCRRTAVSSGVGDDSTVSIKTLMAAAALDKGTSPHEVETAMNSQLFTPGAEGIDLAHKALRDFLAAYHLVLQKLPMAEALNLLVSQAPYGDKIIPELSDVAAWYAGMCDEFFYYVVARDPQVLLRGEVTTVEDPQRAAIVNSLLKTVEKGEATDADWAARSVYGRLDHPGIAEQLLPYIVDISKNTIARRVAFEIAEQCPGARVLDSAILGVALNPKESYSVRVYAAGAIADSGERSFRRALRPLLHCSSEEDKDDELKGLALRALWPGELSASEVFDVLQAPTRPNYFGAYQAFLLSTFVRGLKPADLPIALQWVAAQGSSRHLSSSVRNVTSQIIFIATKFLDHASVAAAFAPIAWLRIREHEELFELDRYTPIGRLYHGSTIDRDRVLDVLAAHAPDDPRCVWSLAHSQSPVVTAESLPYLLRKAVEAKSHQSQDFWTHLARAVFSTVAPRFIAEVLSAATASRRIAEDFAEYIEPIGLGSERAAELKRNFEQYQKTLRPKPPVVLDPPPLTRIVTLLERFEKGDFDAWWRINMEMTLEDQSTHYGNELESDLTSLPGWRMSDDKIRNRIISAAKIYLAARDASAPDWLGKKIFHRPAAAGYRALCLLRKLDQPTFDLLSRDVWRKWAPITLGYPISIGIQGSEDHLLIVAKAYEHAPEEIVHTLLSLVDAENADGTTIFVIRKMEKCWDERLTNALISKVRDLGLKPSPMSDILSLLLQHGVEDAFSFAEELLATRSSSDVVQRRAQKAAVALLLYGGYRGWSAVWPRILNDPEFGGSVISETASSHGERYAASFSDNLSDEQLADLYIWLRTTFPPSSDPEHNREEAYAVTPRDSVAELRDTVLRRLQERGSVESLRALERVSNQWPENTTLKWVKIEAKKLATGKSWRPPTPDQFLRLTSREGTQLRLEK